MKIGIFGIFAGVAICNKASGSDATNNNISSIIDKGDEYVKKIEALLSSNPLFGSHLVNEKNKAG